MHYIVWMDVWGPVFFLSSLSGNAIAVRVTSEICSISLVRATEDVYRPLQGRSTLVSARFLPTLHIYESMEKC